MAGQKYSEFDPVIQDGNNARHGIFNNAFSFRIVFFSPGIAPVGEILNIQGDHMFRFFFIEMQVKTHINSKVVPGFGGVNLIEQDDRVAFLFGCLQIDRDKSSSTRPEHARVDPHQAVFAPTELLPPYKITDVISVVEGIVPLAIGGFIFGVEKRTCDEKINIAKIVI